MLPMHKNYNVYPFHQDLPLDTLGSYNNKKVLTISKDIIPRNDPFLFCKLAINVTTLSRSGNESSSLRIFNICMASNGLEFALTVRQNE